MIEQRLNHGNCAICRTSFDDRARQWDGEFVSVGCWLCERDVCVEEECHHYLGEGIYLCGRCYAPLLRIVTVLIAAIRCGLREWAMYSGNWDWERGRVRLGYGDSWLTPYRRIPVWQVWLIWYWFRARGK